MPWKERTIMTERLKFVHTAQQEGANKRALCRAYGISSRTAYKWLDRYKKEGEPGLADRSRRPHSSPNQTANEMETKVLGVRKARSELICSARGLKMCPPTARSQPSCIAINVLIQKSRKSEQPCSALKWSNLTKSGRWISKDHF